MLVVSGSNVVSFLFLLLSQLNFLNLFPILELLLIKQSQHTFLRIRDNFLLLSHPDLGRFPINKILQVGINLLLGQFG